MKRVSLLAAMVSMGAVGFAHSCIRTDLRRIRCAERRNNDYLGTIPTGINSPDVITVMTVDAYGVTRGFVRTSSGDIATFAAPNAGTDSSSGTWPWGIMRRERHGRLCRQQACISRLHSNSRRRRFGV